MEIFICRKAIDEDETKKIISDILSISNNSISVLYEKEHHDDWKLRVERKFQESDFVLFLLGNKTFESSQVKWEYKKAKELNKRIICLKLKSATDESIKYCHGNHIFDNINECINYFELNTGEDRQLLVEQYKIMVSSTEKVTEQRMKVNNLFFTVTSTILSLTILIGKAFEFSMIGILAMILVTSMAFIVTFFWEKLVNSYGQLNEGKFLIINKIEKKLHTSMFEDEWNILTNIIKYEPNTKTEVTIVKRFRTFILIIGVLELTYLFYLIFMITKSCN